MFFCAFQAVSKPILAVANLPSGFLQLSSTANELLLGA